MITFFSSLYRSDRYLSTYSKHVQSFTAELLKNNVEFEFIVIANDATPKEQELKEVFSACDWFRYIEVPRESLYATWNRAVSESKGDIIGFWHVDDVRYPNAIVHALECFRRGAELVYFPFTVKWYINFFNFSFLVKWKNIRQTDPALFKDSMCFGPFFCLPVNCTNRVGFFDEQLTIVADFDWAIRANNATKKIDFCDEPAGVFRVDGNGLSSGGKQKHVAQNNIVYLRNNILYKIEEVDKVLMDEYTVDSIQYKDQLIHLELPMSN